MRNAARRQRAVLFVTLLGWVTDRLWVNHLGITSHLGQLSLSSFRGRQMATGNTPGVKA